VFRSFRTELITKNTLSLVTVPCILSSLCSRSRRFWMHCRNWRCGIACRMASCFSWSSGALWKRRSRRQEQITRDQIGWVSRAEDHSYVFKGQNSPLFLQMCGQPTEELGGPPRGPSHPLELADTFRTRELTCQRYPKWHFIGLRWIFFYEHTSRCWMCYLWRNDPNPHDCWRSLPTFGLGNPHRKVRFPHGIVIERWFEHLVRFQDSFLEC